MELGLPDLIEFLDPWGIKLTTQPTDQGPRILVTGPDVYPDEEARQAGQGWPVSHTLDIKNHKLRHLRNGSLQAHPISDWEPGVPTSSVAAAICNQLYLGLWAVVIAGQDRRPVMNDLSLNLQFKRPKPEHPWQAVLSVHYKVSRAGRDYHTFDLPLTALAPTPEGARSVVAGLDQEAALTLEGNRLLWQHLTHTTGVTKWDGIEFDYDPSTDEFLHKWDTTTLERHKHLEALVGNLRQPGTSIINTLRAMYPPLEAPATKQTSTDIDPNLDLV